MNPSISFYISNWYDSIFVHSEYFFSGDGSEASINCTKLDLQEWIQLEKKTFLNIIMETSDCKVWFVFKFQYFRWILEQQEIQVLKYSWYKHDTRLLYSTIHILYIFTIWSINVNKKLDGLNRRWHKIYLDQCDWESI